MSTPTCATDANTTMIKIKKIEWPSFAKDFIASWFIAECFTILIGLIFLINETSPHEVKYLHDLLHGQSGAWQFFVAVIGAIFVISTACSMIFVPLVGLPLIICLVRSGFDGLISFALCSAAASIVMGLAAFFITSSMVIDDRVLILALVVNFCVTIMLSFWMMYRRRQMSEVRLT
jgi:hypothetical protein